MSLNRTVKNGLLKILLLVICVAITGQAMANGFSYVFIQGDKTTPFYVKFEDQMLPRYGKNYSIISQLVPGPINIQILFQQNTYPPQKFTVVVPENGFRGFLLLQKNGVFSLYDIQQQFYLQPGNRAEDDRVAPQVSAETYVYKPGVVANEKVVSSPPASTIATKPRGNKSVTPKFLPNIELNNERVVQQETRQPQEVIVEEEVPAASTEEDIYTEPQTASQPVTAASAPSNSYIANSDCPFAINDGEFEDLYNKTQARSEKVKLKFLLTKVVDCYSTNQARLLAETLNNDPERYTFFKKVYPRVTDQHNFYMLENLLSTQEWKDYFKLILPK